MWDALEQFYRETMEHEKSLQQVNQLSRASAQTTCR